MRKRRCDSGGSRKVAGFRLRPVRSLPKHAPVDFDRGGSLADGSLCPAPSDYSPSGASAFQFAGSLSRSLRFWRYFRQLLFWVRENQQKGRGVGCLHLWDAALAPSKTKSKPRSLPRSQNPWSMKNAQGFLHYDRYPAIPSRTRRKHVAYLGPQWGTPKRASSKETPIAVNGMTGKGGVNKRH